MSAEQGPKEYSLLRVGLILMANDFQKGCSQYSRQLDSGTGKEQDICMANERRCPYYDGQYQSQGETQPVGPLSQYDVSIAPRVQLGFCRLQKDIIRVGPIALFDKKLIRPTPRDK